ncbi:MAG: hypothetical protein ACTSYB_12835 [Candidatus Helarchaeota archaeon]
MEPSELKWYTKTEKDQVNPLIAFITEVENGLFLLISDKAAQLGTIAIGLPTLLGKNGISTSSIPIVFGIRNDLLTRAIAERVAFRCKKIVIASTHLSEEAAELSQRTLRFVEEVIKDYFSQKQ